MVRVTLTSLSFLGTVVMAARAQEASPGSIETDRPDFTEASSLVSPGRFQVETGVTVSRPRGANAVSQYSWPEVLLRVGVGSGLEIRLGQSLASIDNGVDDRFTAAGDLYAGVKLGVAEQRGAMPQLAVMLQASIPTGDSRLSAGEWLPGGALLAGWGTDGPLSYAAGVQLNRSPISGVVIGPSFATGIRLTDRVKGYGEWFAFIPAATDVTLPAAHYGNGGLALLLSNDAQLDGRIGFGLNDAADKVFFGLGLSIRH